MKKYVIRDSEIRANAALEVLDLPVGDEVYEVVIRPHKKDRSLEQNALLWALHNAAASYVGEECPERLHEVCCRRFLGHSWTRDPLTGEDYGITNTTTAYYDETTGSFRKLSIAEMAEFITKVEHLYTSMGVPTVKTYGGKEKESEGNE